MKMQRPFCKPDLIDKKTIVAGLKSLGVERGNVLLVHSSLKSFGKVAGGADAVIDALLEAAGDDGTLVMPSFTNSFFPVTAGFRAEAFDVNKTPASGVGIIPEIFRRRPGVLRSNHPTHSVCAFGRQAGKIISTHKGLSPYNRRGPFGKMHTLNAKIVFLGCGMAPNSTLHAVEDWLGLPYLERTKVMLKDRKGRERIIEVPGEPMGHRGFYYMSRGLWNPRGGVVSDRLRAIGLVREGRIGQAMVEIVPMRKMVAACFKLLRKEPDLLLCSDNRCAFCRCGREKIRKWKAGKQGCFRAGFSRVSITPPPGLYMVGYGGNILGTGSHRDLYSQALVMDDGQTMVAMVDNDLLGIESDLVRKIRQRVELMTGISGANVMVAVTHNHSGPNIRTIIHKHTVSKRFQNFLIDAISGAVWEAWLNLKESRVGIGTGQAALNINRRVLRPDGSIDMIAPTDPIALAKGPVDREVGVISFKDMDGKIMGVLVNYTAHGVCVPHGGSAVKGDDRLFSADYPGFLYRHLRENGVPFCVYTNGAIGNIHPKYFLQGYAGAEKMGRELGNVVLKIIKKLSYTESVTLTAHKQFLNAKLRKKLDPRVDRRKVDRRVETQILGVNQARFVSIPGELFVELGLEIKKRFKPKTAFIVYANGTNLYFPTRKAYQEGGYEPSALTCYFMPGTPEKIVQAINYKEETKQ